MNHHANSPYADFIRALANVYADVIQAAGPDGATATDLLKDAPALKLTLPGQITARAVKDALTILVTERRIIAVRPAAWGKAAWRVTTPEDNRGSRTASDVLAIIAPFRHGQGITFKALEETYVATSLSRGQDDDEPADLRFLLRSTLDTLTEDRQVRVHPDGGYELTTAGRLTLAEQFAATTRPVGPPTTTDVLTWIRHAGESGISTQDLADLYMQAHLTRAGTLPDRNGEVAGHLRTLMDTHNVFTIPDPAGGDNHLYVAGKDADPWDLVTHPIAASLRYRALGADNAETQAGLLLLALTDQAAHFHDEELQQSLAEDGDLVRIDWTSISDWGRTLTSNSYERRKATPARGLLLQLAAALATGQIRGDQVAAMRAALSRLPGDTPTGPDYTTIE